VETDRKKRGFFKSFFKVDFSKNGGTKSAFQGAFCLLSGGDDAKRGALLG
jgi:hypothetical protein